MIGGSSIVIFAAQLVNRVEEPRLDAVGPVGPVNLWMVVAAEVAAASEVG